MTAERPGPIPNSYWLPDVTVIAGEYPGARDVTEARAKLGQILDAGVGVFLDLTGPVDGLKPYEDLLLKEADRRNVQVTYERMSIPDMDVTGPTHMNEVLDTIEHHVSEGRTVYVHCWGGVGRTGLVVGCLLVRHGLEGRDALDKVRSLFGTMSKEKVRRHSGGSPQTPAQLSMVSEWARHDLSTKPRRAPATVTRRDRYLGAMLGLAAGDALGTTLEFRAPGSFEPITDMVGGGPFRLKPGQWTDDTSMALCLADSLLACNGFDAADQMRRYVRWWKEGYWSSTGRCLDIGNTVSSALASFERTGEPFSGSTDEMSAGNGSIMRLAPIPLFFSADAELAIRMAGESSRTTHGTRAAVDSCRYFAGLVLGALAGVSKEELSAPH